MSNSELKRALEFIKKGEKSQARMILNGILRENPKNVNAWLMVMAVARNNEEKAKAAKNVLKLQPGNPKAQKILRGLQHQKTATQPPQKSQTAPATTVGDLMTKPKPESRSKPVQSGIQSFDDEDEIFDFDKPAQDDNVFDFDTPNEYDDLFGSGKSSIPSRKAPASRNKSSSNAMLFVGLGFVAVLAFGVIAVGIVMMSADSVDGLPGGSSGQTIRETVSVSAGDADNFEVYVEGLYQITASGSGNFDPVIEVFDDDGDLLAYNDDNHGVRGLDTLDAFIEVVRIDGYARIQIRDFWEESGSAEVVVEPFTGISSFRDIEVGDSRTLDIDEARWLTLDVGSERELTITVANARGDVDPILEIFDEDFRLIARNDDHNSNLDLNSFDSAIEDIDLSGTVYLHVTDFIGNTDGRVTVTVQRSATHP